MLKCSACRKGDYYRYLAEFKSGNEKKEAADQSMKAYEVQFILFYCFCSLYDVVYPIDGCLLSLLQICSAY